MSGQTAVIDQWETIIDKVYLPNATLGYYGMNLTELMVPHGY